jgi:hypothetical protein
MAQLEVIYILIIVRVLSDLQLYTIFIETLSLLAIMMKDEPAILLIDPILAN